MAKFNVGDPVTIQRNGAKGIINAIGHQAPRGDQDYQIKLDATGRTEWHYESELS